MLNAILRGVIVFLPALIAAGCVGLAGKNERVAIPLQVEVPVLFATDRNIYNSTNPDYYFGGIQGEMSFGLVDVAISTRKQGNSAIADWSRWEPVSGKQSNGNALLNVEPMGRAAFDDVLAEKLVASDSKSVLVYIHGYSRTFKTAAQHAAIIAYEFNINGLPVLYSWPSQGNLIEYADDRESVARSKQHLVEFMRSLSKQPEVVTIHVLAHSLGSVIFIQALSDLLDDPAVTGSWKLGEVILFSPDLDIERFSSDYLPVLQALDSRVTLYVSGLDMPLHVSMLYNRSVRLGDATEGVFVAPGIETIDVTPATNLADGHTAHIDSPVIHADLHFLINERLPADERPTLMPLDTERGRYWQARESYP